MATGLREKAIFDDFREECMSGWKNSPLVVERAYCVSASAYLVDGSLNPQIMETWGWMASLIRSKRVV